MLGIFLDIETTGLDSTRHYPIDIAFQVLDLSSGKRICSYESVVKLSWEMWEKKDSNSIKINGFTWDEISRGKEFSVIKAEIIAYFTQLQIQRGSAVFICQNPSFDRGFFNQILDVYTQEKLNWPYHWLDLASMFWAIYASHVYQEGKHLPEKMSVSKNDIAQYYQLPEERDPHRAMNGVDHLIICYQAVLKIDFNRGVL